MATDRPNQVENDRLRTEVVALTQALAAAERRYSVVSENITDVIYITDPNGRIKYVSPSIQRVLGFTPEERIGKTLKEQDQPVETQRSIRRLLEQTARGEIEESTSEQQLETKDGRLIWCEAKSRPVRDENGVVAEHYIIIRDISDRKAATDALIESERLYRLVSENVADVIYVFDENGDCEYASPSVERLFGVSSDVVVGQNFQDLHVDRDAMNRSMEMFTKARQGHVDEYRLESPQRTASDESLWTETNHRAVRGSDGRLQAMHVVQRDVTEQKRLTALLERERERLVARGERLDALNDRLESFAATVSHDLQSPLRRIERMLHRAESEPEPDAALLHNIGREALEMSEFVDHVLDISRSHAQPLKRSEIDIAALFAHVVDRTVRETGRACTTSLPKRPVAVQADPQLVRSVLENIINNAFKYVPVNQALHLQLRIDVRDGTEAVSITDNGDGFTDSVAGLTGSFHRGSNAVAQPGHGIGLATVRTMVERHEGRLWFENDQQAGARVVFTLGEVSGP